jgi:hypothetical protein
VDEGAGEPAVKLPLLGRSVPMYIFADLGLPVVGVPIANFDDNQHSPNDPLHSRSPSSGPSFSQSRSRIASRSQRRR